MSRPWPLPRWLASGTLLAGLVAVSVPVAGQDDDTAPVEGYAALVGGAAPGPGVIVVLRSDVVFRARLLAARRGVPGADSAAPSATALEVALGELVGEALVASEAIRVGIPDPRAGAVAGALAELEAWVGGAEALRTLARGAGLGEDELRGLARRRARVRGFLEANLEGAAVVTDARLREVWRSGEHPFGDAIELADVRDELRAWLARRELQRALVRWVRVLRGRSTVRILVPWGAGGAAS